MSIAVMSRLFKAQLGSPSRKMLAIRLADFADDDGRGIWPTVGRLALETELSERTVQRLLRDFVDEGLLIVVAEGGGRPGQATRYDFDMRALDNLQSGKPVADGCHGVTGVTVSPVTTEAPTGDIDDADGCHGVTQTVIEPLDKPLGERARESEDDGRESRKSVERSFKRGFHGWPTAISDSEPEAFRVWLSLTPEERQAAVDEAARYVEAAKATGRKLVCSYAVYLRERRWEKLPAKAAVEQSGSAQAAPLGKMWGARVYELLLNGPTRVVGLTQIERGLVESGRYSEEYLLHDKQAKQGFPAVNELFERAAGGRGALVPARLQAIKDLLVQVRIGGDEWKAWADFHSQQGWPWFPDPGNAEWAYFPAGGPEGLNGFEIALRGLGENDGN
ncbi:MULTISPECIES: helix-turn-helix domain-containing protein [Brucella]|uniref:Helix-turn-helix domain-containing protein n=1 Tax=Brucella tritici TaxID=94626 RepID=A0A6L3YB77_9HYPH|nr:MULTISPECIES: helix-turn-helix domain-containing protein [Brucella]KAB2680513.1 helix-turn-helix domain-containing protein [Brucella tritici]KAB2731579.1 helix-turn-helix domain-containing protein [Brucella anthropi]